ncbi:MAG: response regulator [Desulfobacteraceae bacterium]|nr:MAG: response regulator [Desulfobacteraceae bacterium]
MKIADPKQHLFNIVENFPDIILTINDRLTILFLNKPFFGTPVSEATGKNILDLIITNQKELLIESIKKSIKSGGMESIEVEDHFGEWWAVRILYMKVNTKQKFPLLLIVFRNITKQKKTEVALRESEERHRSLFMNNPIKTIIVDHNGIVTGYNKKWADNKNESVPDRVPNVGDRMYSDDFAGKHEIDMRAQLMDCIRKGESKTFPELKYKNKYLSVNITPYPFGAIITSKDITDWRIEEEERKKFELWHLQTQKIEAVGTLASGIAHEFNNILWIINGNIELAANTIPMGNQARYHLEQVEEACARAKELVMQIISFTKQSDQNIEPLKIGLVVKEFFRLIRPSLPSTIEIHQMISAENDTVMADLTQINQLLMNLCTNAYYAMKDRGGKLEINVLNIDIEDEDTDLYKDLTPGKYVLITISDTGHGIKPEIMKNIFDPFFTTRSESELTGMGLSVVHGIVKNHGGAITVQSNDGKGTVFNIFLPCYINQDIDILPTRPAISLNHEKILFVDDDKAIVDAAKRMLERLGYHVSTALNGNQALKFFQTESHPFDIIITDMTMPGLTGADLAKKIFEIDPDSAIILCTGFSTSITPQKAMDIGFKDFLLKPVTKNKIAETIRRVIDQKQEMS